MIEKALKDDLAKGIITRSSIMQIVGWGHLRNPKRVKCPSEITIKNEDLLYSENMYAILSHSIKGIGPTYLSKIIRFACPDQAGAIDTRIVRVFGAGDSNCFKHNWLDLKAVNYGYGWYINEKQKNWPQGYFEWLKILRYLKQNLNAKHISCLHPDIFLINSLREKGVWTCADVEMALFSYSSYVINHEAQTGKKL